MELEQAGARSFGQQAVQQCQHTLEDVGFGSELGYRAGVQEARIAFRLDFLAPAQTETNSWWLMAANHA